jgi:hypothetical protein
MEAAAGASPALSSVAEKPLSEAKTIVSVAFADAIFAIET